MFDTALYFSQMHPVLLFSDPVFLSETVVPPDSSVHFPTFFLQFCLPVNVLEVFLSLIFDSRASFPVSQEMFFFLLISFSFLPASDKPTLLPVYVQSLFPAHHVLFVFSLEISKLRKALFLESWFSDTLFLPLPAYEVSEISSVLSANVPVLSLTLFAHFLFFRSSFPHPTDLFPLDSEFHQLLL